MSDTELKEKELNAQDHESIPGGLAPGEQAALDQIEAGLNDENGLYSGKDKPKAKSKSPWKKIGASVAVVGGIISIVIAIFTLPILKLEAYLDRVEQRAFTYAVNAMEHRAERLFDKYMIRTIIDLDSCNASASINCTNNFGNGIASRLFRTWKDVKIEEKIFDGMGFHLETNLKPDGTGYRYTIRDRRDRNVTFNLDDQNKWNDFKSGQFTGGGRELGRDLRKVIKEETKWYQVFERRSLRHYFERKHGVRFFCFFACKAKDTIEFKRLSAQTRFKLFFVERLVYPFSGKYGFALDCIIKGAERCSGDIKSERLVRTNVPDAELDEIADHFRNNPNQKFFSFALEKILSKFISKQAAQKIVGAVPVAGQIYLGVWAFSMLEKVDAALESNALSKMAADINASQYLEWYSAMRSAGDEIKSGALTLEEIGAINQEFSGAEESLVYQSLIEGNQSVGEGDPDYKCGNERPIPDGQLVCSEKKVARSYAIENIRDNSAIHAAATALFGTYRYDICPGPPTCSLKTVVNGVITAIDKVSETVLAPVIDGFLGAASLIPGIGDFKDFVLDKFGELVEYIFKLIFPLPIDVDSPGREKFDGLVAGGEVAAEQIGTGGYTDDGEPYGMGGVLLSREQAMAIYMDQQDQLDYEFSQKSLFAKATDLSHDKSIASKLVLSSPGDPQSAMSNFAASIFNVFGLFGNFVGAATAQNDTGLFIDSPFGVSLVGYPSDHPMLTADENGNPNIDPDRLTPQHCEQQKSNWEDSMTENDITGFPEYSEVNLCLLEETVVDSLGAYYTNE